MNRQRESIASEPMWLPFALLFGSSVILLGLCVARYGTKTLALINLVALPVFILLTVAEWRRSERAVGWRPILLAVSALPPLLLAATCWNDPD